MFTDRTDAGKQLADMLLEYKDTDGIVFAIPRGGIVPAYEVAAKLNMPLEVMLVKKIGHPNNKEYAIGAASLYDYFIIPHPDVSQGYIQDELKLIRTRLFEMAKLFNSMEISNLEGKTVIVVDDGIATGNTMLATIQLLKNKRPKKIIVAVPVASQESVALLETEADEIVAISVPANFKGVGNFYKDFNQVEDSEVRFYLDLAKQLQRQL